MTEGHVRYMHGPADDGGELERLRAERDALRARVAEMEADEAEYLRFVQEPCGDEVHCTCVPGLRKIIKRLEAENEQLRTKNGEDALAIKAYQERDVVWSDFLRNAVGSPSLEYFVLRWNDLARQRFIPVSEQLPPEGDDVEFMQLHRGPRIGRQWIDNEQEYCYRDITHWRAVERSEK